MKTAELDRQFWLIILESWGMDEIIAWGEYAAKCES